MIAVFNRSGQLGNRMVEFVHCCATALETGQSLVYFFGKDLLELFETSREICKGHRISLLSENRTTLFMNRAKNACLERFPPCLSRFLFRKGGLRLKVMRTAWLPKIVLSWSHRDPAAVVSQRALICEMFKPKECFCVRPREFLKRCAANRTRVGVHVRRGDYREFADGRFYFSDDDYIRFMKEAAEVLNSENIRFVIVSNETVNVDCFVRAGLDAVLFQGKDYREDMVMLALCDYVMGPVSTFSWAAAYFGNALYRPIWGRKDAITQEKGFREISGDDVDLDQEPPLP